MKQYESSLIKYVIGPPHANTTEIIKICYDRKCKHYILAYSFFKFQDVSMTYNFIIINFITQKLSPAKCELIEK